VERVKRLRPEPWVLRGEKSGRGEGIGEKKEQPG
jgi:hypothetical protein